MPDKNPIVQNLKVCGHKMRTTLSGVMASKGKISPLVSQQNYNLNLF